MSTTTRVSRQLSRTSRFCKPSARLAGFTFLLAASACSGNPAGHRTSASPSPHLSSSAAPGPVVAGRIVFRRFFDNAETSGALFTSNPDGSGERELTPQVAATVDDEPNWAPDGKHLVLTRVTNAGTDHEAHRLFTVAADGTGLTALTADTPARGDLIVGFNSTAAYSPDGTRIAFSYAHGPVDSEVNGGQIRYSDIMVMDADGSHRTSVTHAARDAGDLGGVSWSGDGQHLVYALSNGSSPAAPGGRALYTVDVDGTHKRQLTPWSLGADGTPDWSVGTNLIVFRAVASEDSGVGNFFTIRPDGTGLTQLTHFSGQVISHQVGFSPDGRWIVFGKQDSNGVNDVFTAKADGTDVRHVTTTPLADSSPDWGTGPSGG